MSAIVSVSVRVTDDTHVVVPFENSQLSGTCRAISNASRPPCDVSADTAEDFTAGAGAARNDVGAVGTCSVVQAAASVANTHVETIDRQRHLHCRDAIDIQISVMTPRIPNPERPRARIARAPWP
jgi:hypothetical protein